MFRHQLMAAAATAHIQRVFSDAAAVAPCRHCGSVRACSCGSAEVQGVLALVKSMLPQLRIGEQRFHHADVANAIQDIERYGRALDLRVLERKAAACARTARVEKNEEQVAAFEHLEQAAKHAADALPR